MISVFDDLAKEIKRHGSGKVVAEISNSRIDEFARVVNNAACEASGSKKRQRHRDFSWMWQQSAELG